MKEASVHQAIITIFKKLVKNKKDIDQNYTGINVHTHTLNMICNYRTLLHNCRI
jgi:hypothetical protein